MDTVPPQSPKSTNFILWIILIVVILGVAGYGVYNYFSGNVNENTNFLVNISNKGNINNVTNTNAINNTNIQIDTTDWKTYTNSEYGYIMKYPSDWTYEENYLTGEQINFPFEIEEPVRSTKFYSPDKKYYLDVGIKNKNDKGTIWYRTGIGAGDLINGESIYIEGLTVQTQELVFQGKVSEVFYFPLEGGGGKFSIEIKGYQVRANFSWNSDAFSVEEWNKIDLRNRIELRQANTILSTLKFPDLLT